jgi:hypothetical protein
MTSPELERLADRGDLRREAPRREEIEGLIGSGSARLADAQNQDLSAESRFDLAYGAAHALSLAALRLRGYRSDKRYLVFQSLSHTLGSLPASWRFLAKCHEHRNRIEYEGFGLVDEAMIDGLLRVVQEIRVAVLAIPLPPPSQG